MKGRSLFPRSLAARLALVYGLVSVVVVAALGFGVYFMTARYLLDRANDELAALADFYVAYTAAIAPDEASLAALSPQIVGFFAPQAGYEVRLFDAYNGALLAATRDIGPLPSSAALIELGYRQPTLFLAASHDQSDRLYVARPVVASDGRELAVVEVSRGVSEAEAFLGTLRWVLACAGGLALVASLVASLLLARQMTRPLRQVQSTTQAIAAGDFGRRLSLTSADEIGQLAASVNQMAVELARLEAARRDFIAKISHDLRTPLTAIKGFAINLQDIAPEAMQPSLVVMDEQADRLIHLVDDLLTLSRLQRGELRLCWAEIDLMAVARSAAAVAEEKARRRGVTLTSDLPQALPAVQGDAERLQRVVINLLDNALKFTLAGGTVRLRVAAGKDEILLTVTDDGRGVTAEEAARAFEPYFRGPGGGAGLGLSIAREIVIAHGGRIWLKARSEGGVEAGFALSRPHQVLGSKR